MNERIKRLLNEATSCHEQEHDRSKVMTVSDKEMDKFAQLIVEECLEACSRANEIRHFVPPTQQQVVLSCIDEIERTFWS